MPPKRTQSSSKKGKVKDTNDEKSPIKPIKKPSSPSSSSQKQFIFHPKGQEEISLPVNPKDSLDDPNYLFGAAQYNPKLYNPTYDFNLNEIDATTYNQYCKRFQENYESVKKNVQKKKEKVEQKNRRPTMGYVQKLLLKHENEKKKVYINSIKKAANIRAVTGNKKK